MSEFCVSSSLQESTLAGCTSQYSQAELKGVRVTPERIWPLLFHGHCQLHSHTQRKILPRLKLSQDDHRGHESIKIINTY